MNWESELFFLMAVWVRFCRNAGLKLVTGIEETINPMLIILIARTPIAIVSGLDEKIPISLSGAIRHSMVPRVMTMPIIEREQIKILRTRLCSPAP